MQYHPIFPDTLGRLLPQHRVRLTLLVTLCLKSLTKACQRGNVVSISVWPLVNLGGKDIFSQYKLTQKSRNTAGKWQKKEERYAYLQFFSKAREHVGDTLIDGSCPLKQQEAFRGRSKVQQVVQQRLLPHHAIITTHSASWAARLDSLHVSVDRFSHALTEKTHLRILVANTG